MNTKKQMYQAPSITGHVIELEQGIAAGSGFAAPIAPEVEDLTDGVGGIGFGEG